MSWFNSSLIDAATSEDLPNGEQNIFYNLNICDQVRAKKLPAQEALKQLKRRVMHINPNVQILALHLLDLLVKNGGQHFLEAMAAPDFMGAYTGQIRSQSIQGRDPEVVQLMLEYLQQWAHMTSSKPQLKEFTTQVDKLKSQNYEFPALQQVNANFIDAKVAPEWVDSDTCMKSGQAFSFYNRKHHCRNCGGVFLGEYCKDFVPLPEFGITEPVRVCVDCREKLGGVVKAPPKRKGIASNYSGAESGFDRDLRKALELSASSNQAPQAQPVEAVEMDDDMKAAIAASLADMKSVSNSHQHAQQQQQQAQQAQHQQNQHLNKALPPKPRQIDRGLISDADIDRVAAFRRRLETATPQEAIYDAQIGIEERNAVSLQPKVVKDLGDAADKLQTLEDLHSRIQSISGYYDRFLDAELQRAHAPRVQAQQAPPVPAQPHAQPLAPAQAPAHARVPSYAPTYSQPISRQATGMSTPDVVPSAPSAPSAPQFPSAPDHVPDTPASPVREASPEPMLIDL